MRFIFGFILSLSALPLIAAHQEYSRYECIVQRQMFGKLPEGFDPSKPPSAVQKSNGKGQKELTKEQEQIKKSVRFSMINVNPSGDTMVGFTDSSDAKNVRNYYLKVGETRDGWTVKSADPVKATVSIAKDGIDLDLELGGSSGGAPAKGNVPAAQSANPPFGQRHAGASPLLNRSSGSATGSGNMLGSLRERRMARMQQKAEQAKADAVAKEQREAEKKEREEREAEEKARQEAEREQTKQELQQLKDDIKKAREAAAAATAAKEESVAKDEPKDESGAAATQEE